MTLKLFLVTLELSWLSISNKKCFTNEGLFFHNFETVMFHSFSKYHSRLPKLLKMALPRSLPSTRAPWQVDLLFWNFQSLKQDGWRCILQNGFDRQKLQPKLSKKLHFNGLWWLLKTFPHKAVLMCVSYVIFLHKKPKTKEQYLVFI